MAGIRYVQKKSGGIKRLESQFPISYFPFPQHAFTLAEVLITLGIIGVVASMTIPTLLAKQEKAVALSGLKKSYATLQTMYNNAIAENGYIPTWEWEATYEQDAKLDENFQEILAPNLKIAQYCGTSTSVCWPTGTFKNGNADSTHYSIAAILQDGSALASYFNYNSGRYIMRIYVDINGPKKPNTLGKDRFRFDIDNQNEGNETKLVPYGTTIYEKPNRQACWATAAEGGTSGAFSSSYTGTGDFCAYTIIVIDNWQIANDYKW